MTELPGVDKDLDIVETPLLELKNVGKRFGSFEALSRVNLSFMPGEVHCLLGENGAGKSTVCNLIFGLHTPSSGSMLLENKPYTPNGPGEAFDNGIAMVHQHFSLVDELSVIDNLLMSQGILGHIDRKDHARNLEELSEDFGLLLKPFALVQDLSVGERQRVEIIKCLIRKPRILILDEPTAVLLPEEIASLLDICRQVARSGCSIVLVTHKLAEIEEIADRVTVLHKGRTVAHSQNPADEMDKLLRAMIQNEDAPNLKNGLLGAIDRRPKSNTKNDLAVSDVLQLDGVSYRDEANILRLDNITLSVGRGEIVGIAGVEGNGQTELGLILAGLSQPSAGRWFIENTELTHANAKQITHVGAGIVPEDRHAVASIGQMSLADNIYLNRMAQFKRFGLIDRNAQKDAARKQADMFDVRSANIDVPFSSLSGGNQQKAVLARELTTPNLKFLLAAQPTRGLDIGAVNAVYQMIGKAADDGVGILLISSELDELINIADRIVVFYRGHIAGEFVAKKENLHAIGALMSGKELV